MLETKRTDPPDPVAVVAERMSREVDEAIRRMLEIVEIRINVPERLKQAREALYLTQSELAARFGLSADRISYFETGHKPASTLYIRALLGELYCFKLQVRHGEQTV